MAKKTISRSKNYNNFRMYLERVIKLKISGIIAHFLIEKYSNASHPTTYIRIVKEDLQRVGIMPKDGEKAKEGQYEKFYLFRNEMCSKQILICESNYDELKDKDPNFKAAKFKFGESIKKYMEIAIFEKKSALQRLDDKADQKQVDILKVEVNTLSQNVSALEIKVQLMIELVLEALPPNTPPRQEIARKLYQNKKECVAALKEEKKSHKRNIEPSKKNTELRIVC